MKAASLDDPLYYLRNAEQVISLCLDHHAQLHGHSVTYRIDTGPQQGRKGFTLQTLPGREDSSKTNSRVANQQGSHCTPV
jgi:hypothetical protein